ncbi:MAG: hypothetical protein KF705_12095 [Phycisphaeraceae bacterium]|nr:hypothetical protein [Phycisphaeraceae bacterium]
METGASTHTRLASSLNLSSAVRVLVRILDDFNALARSKPDPASHLSDPDYIRASERARKAAYHLYRLSRIVPIDESILRRVHARSNTQTGSSRVPPLPSASSAALRVADPSAPASPTNSPSASSVALRVEDPSSPASPTNTPSAFTSHPIRPADLIRAASFSTPLRRATNPLLLALQTTDSG